MGRVGGGRAEHQSLVALVGDDVSPISVSASSDVTLVGYNAICCLIVVEC